MSSQLEAYMYMGGALVLLAAFALAAQEIARAQASTATETLAEDIAVAVEAVHKTKAACLLLIPEGFNVTVANGSVTACCESASASAQLEAPAQACTLTPGWWWILPGEEVEFEQKP